MWVSQEWLLGEVAPWLGMEEALGRTCNVCRAWRYWCNNDLTVLHIGNDFQRPCVETITGRDSTRTAGLSTPLFLPLVPVNLRELNLSGAWTSLPARELGTIRRGCRLKKLVATGVRLFSFSYRELLLFEHLEELDISDSQMDVPLPRLRFAEPARGSFSLDLAAPSSSSSSSSSSPPGGGAVPPTPPPPADRLSIIAARAGRRADGGGGGRRRGGHASSSGGGGGAAAGRGGGGGSGGDAFDEPRFAATLKKLVAVKTRLWKRWNLSTFPLLSTLEVSFAGRTMLKQLHRKAQTGSRLKELSVCDLALRYLVRPTELKELAEAVGAASTFRMRRVDVVKEVSNLAYLRALLGRMHNLQVLELTDVALDDGMLGVLGEIFTSARPASSSSSSSSAAAAAAAASSDEAEGAESCNMFFPDENVATTAAANTARQRQQPRGSTGAGGGRGEGGDVAEGLAGSNIRLRTLVLGRCGGVSEAAFEKFFAQACGGARESSGARRAGGSGGGGGRNRGGAAAAAFGLALSTVRLQGCRALGDRGLVLLCAGAKRLSNVQVAGSLLLTDSGVENLTESCPRLTRVDVSGCPRVTSNSLSFLLAKGPALRHVKAWGIRSAGSLSRVIAAHGRDREGAPPLASSASSLRRAFAARGVELAWAGPLGENGDDGHGAAAAAASRERGRSGGGVGSSTGAFEGAAAMGWGEGNEESRAAEAEAEVAAAEGWVEDGPRHACRRGCGAWPKSGDAVDHLEVCPLAPVGCVLRADGCEWIGTRTDRRKHLETCPMWQVKCPVCCQDVQVREFAAHVLGHSEAADSLALHHPGCPLRAYGCRVCRVAPVTAATAAATATSNTSTNEDVCTGGSDSNRYSYEAAAAAAAASAAASAASTALTEGDEGEDMTGSIGSNSGGDDVGWTGRDSAEGYSYAAAAAAAAAAASATAELTTVTTTASVEGRGANDGSTETETVEQTRACGHNNPGICPWYRVQCKSCEQEVGRKEWDDGEHVCTAQRRVDVLSKHASGAGKLRNRQWLIVYGYIGSGGKKGTAEGWEDPTDDAFHGVNPMCAMPSVLSSALPLPGPAGAPVSPATLPS